MLGRLLGCLSVECEWRIALFIDLRLECQVSSGWMWGVLNTEYGVIGQ